MLTTLETVSRRYAVSAQARGPVSVRSGRGELAHLFAALGFTHGAEIGVWKGVFSKTLCQGVRNLRLLCVDPWECYDEYQEQKKNAATMAAAYAEAVDRLAPFRVQIIRERSAIAAAAIPDRSLDFVYVDGNHRQTWVTADLEAWAPKVRAGGIVAGHDYVEDPKKTFIEVKPAVDAYVQAHGISPLFVLTGDKTPSFFWVQA